MIRLFPVETWITQYFGWTDYAKNHYKTGYHEGIDIVPVDRKEWDLYAPISGRIKWAGWGDTYGWNIMLFDERHGMSYRFCHLDQMYVKSGDDVELGCKIGVAGNTGNKGKPMLKHLHLNAIPMYEYGKKDFPLNGTKGRVDPLGVLRALGVWI